MDVALPNGRVIRGVPDGTPKDAIKAKAIASGIAQESDFQPQAPSQPATNFDVPSADQDRMVSEYYENRPQQQPRTMAESVIGAGETALSAITGGTTGLLGQAAGFIQQAGKEIGVGEFGTPEAANRIEQRAADVGASATYAPRTEAGREYAQSLGEISEAFAGAAPLAAELQAIGGAGRAASQGAQVAARDISERAASAIESRIHRQSPENKSMGAAQVDAAARRREMAAQLPVDPKLTEGQATRDMNQLRFENEAMKGELGDPLRQRAAYQNMAIQQSIDHWIDSTAAQGSDLRSVGIAVDSALKEKSNADWKKIRAAYKKAELAGETRQPISTDLIVEQINESRSAESTAPVLSAARKELIRLGGAVEDENGNLQPRDMSLGNAEQLRKFINDNTGYEGPNLAYSSRLKSAIDTTTQNSGGDLYRAARREREKYARQYEDRAIVSDLLETKRGSADRRVALEDVFDRIVFRGSLDDARFMRKTLQTGGESGQQAWKEIQGAGLRYLRDEATKNSARDSQGNPIISPAALDRAVRRLDEDGKLDFIYGKNGANQIRALNDVAKDLFTTPPGTVNHSNTASVLLAALDIGISGTSGVPLPIASGLRIATNKIKDRKIKKRIEQALGKYEEQPPKSNQ